MVARNEENMTDKQKDMFLQVRRGLNNILYSGPGTGNSTNFGTSLKWPDVSGVGAKPVTQQTKQQPPRQNMQQQNNISSRESKQSMPSVGNRMYSKSSIEEDEFLITRDRLREAVIWAEILDKPLSKRKRRHRQ